MIYLLDTNTFSDLMRRDPKVRARLAALHAPDEAMTSTVVRGEVLYGLKRMPAGKRRDELEFFAADLFRNVPSMAVAPDVADHYADIKLQRNQVGLPLDDNDLWIAATARHANAILVSRDKDMLNVPGLVVQDWSK